MITMLWTWQPLSEIQLQLATIRSMNISVVMNYYYAQDYHYGRDGVPGGVGYTAEELTETLAWLDACHAAGLQAAINISTHIYPWPRTGQGPDYARLDALIGAIKDHPALWGWYGYDEAPASMVSIANREAVYSHIKTLTPDKPITYVSNLTSDPGLTGYTQSGTIDIFFEDIYPYLWFDEYEDYETVTELDQFADALNELKAVVVSEGMMPLSCAIQISADVPSGDLPPSGGVLGQGEKVTLTGWDSAGVGFYTWNYPAAVKAANPSMQFAADHLYLQDEIRQVAGGYIDAPVITSFTLPATSTTLTVPVTALTATDDVAVTGYLITESATPPEANDLGWISVTPAASVEITGAEFTFSGYGTRTAWAWAKDADGNVSTGVSASVTISTGMVTVTMPAVSVNPAISTPTVSAVRTAAVSMDAVSAQPLIAAPGVASARTAAVAGPAISARPVVALPVASATRTASVEMPGLSVLSAIGLPVPSSTCTTAAIMPSVTAQPIIAPPVPTGVTAGTPIRAPAVYNRTGQAMTIYNRTGQPVTFY